MSMSARRLQRSASPEQFQPPVDNPNTVQVGSNTYVLTGTNIARDESQIVRYTRTANQTATPTNQYGVEVVVSLSTNKVVSVNNRLSSGSPDGTPIPAGHYVLSGHGQGSGYAGQWLLDNATVGTTIQLITVTIDITNFVTTTVSNTSIGLSWDYSGGALTNFTLRRNGSVIASPVASARTYTDTGLSAGTNYTYTITGNYAAGSTSNTASVSRSTTGGASVLKVMPLGDSITEGMRRSTNTWDGGYRKVLLDRLNANYPGRVNFVGSLTVYSGTMSDKEHEGHSGWTTGGINSNIASWMSTYQPDIVLLHIGTNDIAQSQTSASMIANLTQIMTKIYAANGNAMVILCTIVPMWLFDQWNVPTWHEYNNAIPGIANQFIAQGRNVILANMVSEGGVIADRPNDMGDGWHPSDSGYTKMANLFMQKLTPLL